MIFMGTSVAAGTARAVVVATGMQTEIGRIAGVDRAKGSLKEETPLQQKLDAFGRILLWASLGIVALLFVLGLIRGTNPLELFMTSVSLAVAAVPEGLPAVVTIALALGVLRMSRRRALVRRSAGGGDARLHQRHLHRQNGHADRRRDDSAFALCRRTNVRTSRAKATVRTGRFDSKERRLYARHAAPLLEMANVLIGANNAQLSLEEGTWKVVGDPTEGALLSVGHKAGGSKERLERDLPKHHEIPFDSDRKRHSIVRLLPNDGCASSSMARPICSWRTATIS